MNYFFFLLFILLFSCTSDTNSSDTVINHDTMPVETDLGTPVKMPDFTFGYDLNQATKSFNLPNILQEISGLSMSADYSQIIAIQDEKGTIFFLNKDTVSIDKKVKFQNTGDYEAVELVGEEIYVLKSTGTLYSVRNWNAKKPVVEKFKYPYSKSHDIEGMAYDASANRLLIACKENREGTDISKLTRKIIGFDIKSKKYDSTPIFTLSLDQFRLFLNKYDGIHNFKKINAFFDPESNRLALSPSAIAIHPLTGNIYISSSVGKLLIVLDPNGQILYISKLDKKLFRQPEGLAFDKDGTLYVSNEGKGGKAKLLQFNYMK